MSKRPTPTRRASKPTSSGSGLRADRKWGAALRTARTGSNLSLQQAAELVGITRAFWHQVEKGLKLPSPALGVLMATVMDLPGKARDTAASNALRRPFKSTGCCGHEAAILAAIASAGFDVELQAHAGGGSRSSVSDAVVTLPDGARVTLRMATKTWNRKHPPGSGG